MGYKFEFLNKGGRGDDQPLGQPEATQRADELLAKLSAEKGRLHAELAFFLFSTRIRIAIEGAGPYPDRKGRDALAAMSARMVGAVIEHAWPEQKDAKMDELMKDVDALTEDVFKYLRGLPGAATATKH
jgi:hypothetical protein